MIIDRESDQVLRAAERLRELEASGVGLPEILGGRAGASWVRDECSGDPSLALAALALVHPLSARAPHEVPGGASS